MRSIQNYEWTNRRSKILETLMQVFKIRPRSKSCRARIKPCFQCKKYHPSALCPTHKVQESTARRKHPPPTSVALDDQLKTNANDTSLTQLATIASVKSPSESKVLLMCEEVEIHNVQYPQYKARVLIFFDSESQHSYIDRDLARQLGFIVSKRKELLMSTFGAKKPKKMPYYEIKGMDVDIGERWIKNCKTPRCGGGGTEAASS